MRGKGKEKGRRGRRFPGAARAAVCAAVALAVVGGLVHWGLNRAGAGADAGSVCDGLLARQEIAPLAIDDKGEYESSPAEFLDEEGRYRSRFDEKRGRMSRCPVWQREGKVATFEVTRARDSGPYRSEPIPVSRYFGVSPLGSGLTGWTEEERALVWLPEKCSRSLGAKDGEPVQVVLELENPLPASRFGTDLTRKLMAEVLMSYAGNLAEEKDCGSADFRLTEEAPGGPAEEELPADAQCGLPGFTASRPPADREALSQHRTGEPGKGDWSCVLTRGNGTPWPYLLAAFAVTGDERLVERHRRPDREESEDFRTDLVVCAGHEYLLTMAYPAADAWSRSEHERLELEHAKGGLLPRDTLYEAFLGAARSELGCPA
ncbi:hypothetical protein CUT44_11970 [Streptomyces carminius]|uniref:Uncharacterized protein n=1 Tax=Streptomyces carminius TaxID=2665496 RepID=A0A2M8LZN7_9ACTN|nr:hypothetical protein [Streptomyces carminius]PJE97399.1 hypothetical protein CUT44_11970 [Streptomyces carminius]